jgi:predicted MFS family arabinose efflux permease
MTNGFIFILAIACGAIAANLYYAQTLLSPIGHSIHLAPSLIGFVVTLVQVGYVIGLLFIVPLADFTENRRLIVCLLCLSCLFLFRLAFIKAKLLFLFVCFLLGVSLVIPPIIIPFVSYILPVEKQGQAIGKIIGGLLLGATLARPLASALADIFSWNAIFIFSAALMAIVACLFYCLLPKRTPEHRLSYWKLLGSMPSILKSYPVLRRRALYHAMLFGVFSLFWSSVAMLLSSHIFNYTQGQIALFAFAGAMGGFAAPIAGRLADRGWIKSGTAIAIIIVIAAFIISKMSG